jgi:hypothetical protein
MTEEPTFEARLTSFSGLAVALGGTGDSRVEIPLIQRDYAQGRRSANVTRIRSHFIEEVISALAPGASPLHLDFVYGDLDSTGAFMPLDGQQRLTMMFLLHCYLAWGVGVHPLDFDWAKFAYSTRPEARDFCKLLVTCKVPGQCNPSEWLKDSPDYLPTWDGDATVQSMLVVLEALHNRANKVCLDVAKAWEALTSQAKPAIQFHILSMRASGLTDELYIKMNSRGKPLTVFENFKADFEDLLRPLDPVLAHDFSLKVDTAWSKVFWPYRGSDNLIDDEMMRYFRMVSEINAWLGGIKFSGTDSLDAFSYMSALSRNVYGPQAPRHTDNLGFVFLGLVVWVDNEPKSAQAAILTVQRSRDAAPLLVFKQAGDQGVNFFAACCKHYGSKEWDLADTLMLFAIILYLSHRADDTKLRRLRTVRNLIEASRADEIRAENMGASLADVRRVILDDDLAGVGALNQAHKANELAKRALAEATPELSETIRVLEDHSLLRGGLTAFDLEPSRLVARARAFEQVFDSLGGDAPWLDVTGALIAHGEYWNPRERGSTYKTLDLGSPRNAEPWRNMFRGKTRRQGAHALTGPLMSVLDAIAEGRTLQGEQARFIQSATKMDWRYYLCKYPDMRSGSSGRYVIHPSGYEACMLERTELKSWYADPFLLAVANAAGLPPAENATERWPKSFFGWETNRRDLVLRESGLRIRSVPSGWELTAVPEMQLWDELLARFSAERSSNHESLLRVPQSSGVDTADRVQLGANFLREVMLI